MPKLCLLLLLSATGLLFSSPDLLAQEAQAPEKIADQLARLRHRYKIGDVDGIGEMIEPLFTMVVDNEEPSLDLPQKHLIAMAALKFELASGDHSRAMVPYLIALHLQSELLKQPQHLLLVEPVDETAAFRTKHVPTLFFSPEDQSRFQKQFDNALENGACSKTKLSQTYYQADKRQRSQTQQQIMDDIARVKENPQPSDREIYRLLRDWFSHGNTDSALAEKSLTAAMEGLTKLNRNTEAEKLRSLRRDLRRRAR